MRRGLNTIKTTYADDGLRGTISMLLSYVRWLVGGRPSEPAPVDYHDWIDRYAGIRPDPSEPNETTFTIVCPVFNAPPTLLEQCVSSVVQQTHTRWELLLVDDASDSADTVDALDRLVMTDDRIRLLRREHNGGISHATNDGVAAANGSYLVFLDHDDVLAPSALEWLATCTPAADLVYSDEDKLHVNGERSDVFLKPAWSPRLILGVNYINHVTCVRTTLVREAGGLRPEFDGAQDHDLLLRLADRELKVAHIPLVLYHWRSWGESVAANPSSKREVEARGLRALAETIDRREWKATATLGNGAPFNYRVRWEEEEDAPLVKIIVPTRDRAGLLKRALEGVFNRTDGVRTHTVIIDNGSRNRKTLDLLDQLISSRSDVTVLRVDDAFNYSRLCNLGAAAGPEARYLLFLNNDVEIVHRNWLLQLTGWLRDPHVVGVGPKLLFPDRTIQHAGVIIGLGGIAGHYAGYLPDQPMLGNLHDQAREVGCLTAACLLVRSEDYAKVGGMNEALALDFQDVDLCLRLRESLGGELMYDPTYPLVHLQSASRGTIGASSGYTRARMYFLWGPEILAGDPYYNPHLTLMGHDFALRSLPESSSEAHRRLQPRWSR